MKERLKEIIKEFQEQCVVQRIADAQNHWEQAASFQQEFQEELAELKEMLKYAGPIEYGEIHQEEAIEIFLICFMGDIGDKELLMNEEELLNTLRAYRGKLEDIAWEMSDFLLEGIKERNKKFLINRFFIIR